MHLTTRQTKFVAEYALSGNAAEAARKAGYSANGAKVTGCRLLTNPNLQAAIAASRRQEADELELRREHIVGAILQAIDVAKSQNKAGPMISGWREIAKMLGFYDPASLAAEQRSQQTGREAVRGLSASELMGRLSADGRFRNPDGSPMLPGEIDAFYHGLSDKELQALSEGRARVVTRVEILESATG